MTIDVWISTRGRAVSKTSERSNLKRQLPVLGNNSAAFNRSFDSEKIAGAPGGLRQGVPMQVENEIS
jgi:hypothetical protein